MFEISNINKIKDFLNSENLDFLLVNDTDEYLNEYIPIEENSRYHITGFTGSTGDALVSKDTIYLFVDGRYHQQADKQVDHEHITVVKLDMQTTQTKAVEKIIKEQNNETKIGIIASKIGYLAFKKLSDKLENAKFIEYDFDPVLKVLDIKTEQKNWYLRAVPESITGINAKEKYKKLIKNLPFADYFITTKLDEIAYLTNLRGNEIPFNSSFKAKAIISKEKSIIFTDFKKAEALKDQPQFGHFEFIEEKEFTEHLKNLSGTVALSEASLNLQDFRSIEQSSAQKHNLAENPLAQMKSIKNESEIAHLKECFLKTDIVISRLKKWLNINLDNDKAISEKNIADKVEDLFIQEGALGLSFQVIASAGKNTSIIHYSNPDPEKIIKKGDLILVDCGGYFEGGYATDITRTFLAGNQKTNDEKIKKVYTTVLKAFLNALNFNINNLTTGFDIDKAARDIININPIEGFSFAHGTGHGVGICVHESPPGISPAETAKKTLNTGMVFTIEPGLYNSEWGGVRLENTVTVIEENDKKTIQSLAKSSFDERLIDFTMLDAKEKNGWKTTRKGL